MVIVMTDEMKGYGLMDIALCLWPMHSVAHAYAMHGYGIVDAISNKVM